MLLSPLSMVQRFWVWEIFRGKHLWNWTNCSACMSVRHTVHECKWPPV